MGTQDRALKLSFRLALVFFLIQILVIISSWRFLPQKLPLFYSRPWGEEQLISPVGLLLVPLFSLAIFLLNLIVVALLPEEENLPRQLLMVVAAVFNFLNLIALIQIVRLVI